MNYKIIFKALIATVVTLMIFSIVIFALTLLDNVPEWIQTLLVAIGVCYVIIWIFYIFYKHFKYQ